MLDIGAVHRTEYELDIKRTDGVSAGKRAGMEGAAETSRVAIAQAPGRMHFLGEHGTLGAGLYLSAAIDRCVQVAVSQRKDNSLRFHAPDLNERKRTTMLSLKYKREDRWANYAKVAIHLFTDLGIPVRGLNFTITGDIPQNVGLASSTAVEVASAVALRSLLKARISDTELARKLADIHFAYFEKNPDIIDYVIGLSGRSEQFLVIDEATLEVTKIKSPFSKCKIIITDSRVPRSGVEAELAIRDDNLATALEVLSGGRKDASLREFAATDIMDSMGHLPEKIRRRTLHVVQEMHRVSEAAELLRRCDLAGFSKLIFHSHEGLRDLYEISCPEIDWMVKRAQETPDVFGARMAGHGFGGCTYAIVRNEAVDEYRQRLEDYERIFGFHPKIHELKIATGSRLIEP
jgi:galactokinase